MIAIFLPFILPQTAFPIEGLESNLLVMSPGNEIIKYLLKGDKIRGLNSLLPDHKWSNAYWPTYDRKKKLVYFEAENQNFGMSRQIFCIKLDSKSQPPIKVIEGRRPSISLDGRSLAYYRHPNELWMLDIKSEREQRLVSDISDHQPAVWISDRCLLYMNNNIQMIKLDVVSGNTEETGCDHVIPSALSPDGDRVLCGSYDGKKIFLYNIEANEMKLVKKTHMFSMGSSFVWSHDGKSFLYTRQTWTNLVKFDEIRSLFLYSFNGKEKKLMDRFSLFGGISIR